MRFVKNITTWNEMKPGFYHGHISYLDFAKFGVKKRPIYINVIRDPIERLVSYYYFLRFGDDYRPGLRRRKQGDKKVICLLPTDRKCALFNVAVLKGAQDDTEATVKTNTQFCDCTFVSLQSCCISYCSRCRDKSSLRSGDCFNSV